LKVKKPPGSAPRQRSVVSEGGGERDSHHAHDPKRKGGAARRAS
jgi:hypothetical protein